MDTKPNPKDSMKSTWRNDKSQWGFWHYLYEWFSIMPTIPGRETPVHSKDDPIPWMSDWQLQKWVISHAILPLALQQLIVYTTGYNFGRLAAFFYYSIWFKAIAIHELVLIRHLGHIYGFFDGDSHARDEVPDWSVGKVIRSLIATSSGRPMMAVMISYSKAKAPSSIDWFWLPIEIGLYGIILDFWFYWYHRLMHDVDWLWRYHRTHHLTKHPNPLLTLYADTEQEIMDIAGIPLLTYVTMKYGMGMPMGFYEWWIAHMYVVFSELFGHSGVRVLGSPPSTLTWLLRWTGTELVIEDHDLHHRKGWKKSFNYGKQTRLWDVIFGTARDRIECIPKNLDYNTVVELPLLSMPNLPSS
ncbi:uncharacterized protein PV09_05207 [Verruconis gallopava]|uniref:Fatty acid hydroxylase domain-containing protein n=1 Tax=Verruconis gallopava TaxID=253628 RepID=A0A0D1YS33_9PEZI|nr:uncharacterized protein PV09_05207 [Verruconis gallopava]KIW03437.1 hypothetical protein PV09_05207 [Verruconis gallopava]